MLQVCAVGHSDMDGTGLVVDDGITHFDRQMVCTRQVEIADIALVTVRDEQAVLIDRIV